VKQFVRGLVLAPAPAPVVRFETEPGHQMQAGWATVRRGADKLKVFIATLGWSRAAYVEFCDEERVETLIQAHGNALLAMDAAPVGIPLDHYHAHVVVDHVDGDAAKRRAHPGFLDYARHAGFLPRLCQPYRRR
jgi:transposase